ncbi:transcription termination/antitermination protein NusG [Corynebacterium stationis]|uniref:Transcription termination/antitermination protein NusG n=2 Tax=Corynebacterium stationis TaxID=1705 RepID=A0AB36CK49_9CORY|nr:transcription termination/antitermination protein NusG [Corynebacterium stationis]
MEHIMTENNEDTGNNIGDAVIESVQEQAAEAAEATESNDATEAMDTVEAPPAEVEAVDADPAEAESAEAPSAEEEAEVDADADYRRRLRKYTKELKELPGQWYIIQCYSGYENKVKTNLDMRAQTLEVEDSIFDVVVPVEQVIENKDGKKKLVKRKLLPGYVLVRMELNDAAWSVVRDTPGVTSFVGNEGNATPVKHRDVAKFLLPKEGAASAGEAAANAAEGEQVISMPEQEAAKKYAHDYVVGEAVTILSGPFASVSATISEIDEETGKMVGLVSIFGRETPVELSPTEIERIN